MKSTLALFILGLTLTGAASAAPADAPPPPNLPPPPSGPPPGMTPGNISQDEMHELSQAHDTAFKSNPSLQADVKSFMEAQQAMQARAIALQEKIKGAMIKADPKVEAIFAKMEAGMSQRPGGMPMPPPPSTPPPSMPKASAPPTNK